MASVTPMSFFTPDETINPNEYTFEIADAAARSSIEKIFGDFATIENTLVASKAYAVGDMFIHDGYLYRATLPVNAGASFVEGTNAVKDTVNEYVKGLVNPYKPIVDCDDPQTYYGTYNRDSSNSPYTTGATTAVAGILISLRKAPAAWNKQIAISDGDGELFKRSTADTAGTWSAWTRLIPKFAHKSFSISYTVAGNNSAHLTSNIAMTGYAPVAIAAFTSNNGVVLTQHLTINASSNTLDVWIRNIGSSSVTQTYGVAILYVTSGFGV